MPPDSFLHERSDFKALVETVADSKRSMIQLSWKKTTGSCMPSMGSNSLA